MTAIATLLEDFSTGAFTVDPAIPADLPGFDDGYNAGWEDASLAHKNSQEALKSELSQALQESAFTFQEARSHVLKALRPLMSELTRKVLPDIAYRQAGAHVIDALIGYAEKQASESLTLHVAPESRRDIELLLPPDLAFSVSIRDDSNLAPGQTRFEFEHSETELDIPEMLFAITRMVDDYFDQLPEAEVVHG